MSDFEFGPPIVSMKILYITASSRFDPPLRRIGLNTITAH